MGYASNAGVFWASAAGIAAAFNSEAPDNSVSPASFSEALQLFIGRLTKLKEASRNTRYDRAERVRSGLTGLMFCPSY